MAQINDDKLRMVTLRIEERKLERLDKFAKKMKLNRAQLVRNLIDGGLDNLEVMQKTGVLAMALKGYDLFEIFRDSIRDDKYRVEGEKLIIDL